MAGFGFPAYIPVPSLYRVVRCLPLDENTTAFTIRTSPADADVLAEVQALYPAVTSQDIGSLAIIKQVDIANSGLSDAYAAQSTAIEYIEHTDGNAPPSPDPATARNVLAAGSSASYPSPMGREMTGFSVRTVAVPAAPQLVNVIIWFDVPGFGS